MAKKNNKASPKKNNQQNSILLLKKRIKEDSIHKIKQREKQRRQKKKVTLFYKKVKNYLDLNLVSKHVISNSNDKIFVKWIPPATQIIQNSTERFEKEIIEYFKYITPDEDSLLLRNDTVELLKEIIDKYYPNWSVSPYGSFKQNLCTVFSDVDMTIYEEKIYQTYRSSYKKTNGNLIY